MECALASPDKPPRLAFGSCRTSVSHDRKGNATHGVDSMRAYALGLADPEAAARIPVTPTAEGFESKFLYWDTFREGHPVFRITFRLARDGQVRAMIPQAVAP